ncbi:hypothetical protein LGR81_22795 [Enterobacter hormaechei]|uniref:hypothetical protein n=1 Tax=Enterobacter hormaechei TaxID=158836 RepID=UPI001F408441|nr:hypothetical protein [Enterobacter hormaechei]MCF2419016.1 hypothetical protein [Enterobacter hormaechei]MDL4070086.1 hypothetical protein [Enterobacter hormaechei subsp. xiangfangensis]MDR9929681.1 hypothetical protein [Enterobacter hormaechei subsp. xiangfangensis]MDR9958384.1 hypothetical protein [Enterobacter hormaechei subsp. xiangfangensis]MDS0002144.1 hypothetical protein [Enterobacter hormaechei subsp. xiangfangensis]
MIIFWDTVKENVEVIGTLATSLAFLATAWAAYEARHNAKAAMRATRLTAASLLEMKKSSFKEWYGILLEQHNKLLEDVNKTLLDDSQYNLKLDMNVVKGVYYHATKNPVYIKYVNHLILILNYVDKDFYLPTTADSEKRSYIEQLRNSISPKVSLLIAIFGLNIDNNKTYDAKKLYSLLNKYNFFENELFFEEAISKVHYIDTYVADIFIKEYQRDVAFYVDEMVLGREVSNINAIYRHQRATFAILWSYNNPCQQHLLQRFNDLPLHMRNSIELKMEKAADKVAKFNSWLPGFVGWELKISGNKVRVIKDEKELKRLIKLYYKYPFNARQTGMVLTNGATNRFGEDIEQSLSNYALDKAYLELSSNQHKDKVIDEIVVEVEKMGDKFKAELNSFGFN